MNKETNAILMGIAEDVLNDISWNCPLFKNIQEGRNTIYESYNGQIASLGVSILTIGLKPTVSVFYQDAPRKEGEDNDAYRKCVLEVIAKMLTKYRTEYDFSNADDLCRTVIRDVNDSIKTDLINCSIALKEVVRTYKLG